MWIKRLNGGDLHVVSDICQKEAHPKISQFLLSLTRIHSIWEMIIFIRCLPSERVPPCHKISQITLFCSCWDAVMTAGEMKDFWHSHSETYWCTHLLLVASRWISVTPSAVMWTTESSQSRTTTPARFACGELAFNNKLWVCMWVFFGLWELLCLRGWFLWKLTDLNSFCYIKVTKDLLNVLLSCILCMFLVLHCPRHRRLILKYENSS